MHHASATSPPARIVRMEKNACNEESRIFIYKKKYQQKSANMGKNIKKKRTTERRGLDPVRSHDTSGQDY